MAVPPQSSLVVLRRRKVNPQQEAVLNLRLRVDSTVAEAIQRPCYSLNVEHPNQQQPSLSIHHFMIIARARRLFLSGSNIQNANITADHCHAFASPFLRAV